MQRTKQHKIGRLIHTKISFGKYRGVRVTKIKDLQYLQWALSECRLMEEEAQAVTIQIMHLEFGMPLMRMDMRQNINKI